MIVMLCGQRFVGGFSLMTDTCLGLSRPEYRDMEMVGWVPSVSEGNDQYCPIRDKGCLGQKCMLSVKMVSDHLERPYVVCSLNNTLFFDN